MSSSSGSMSGGMYLIGGKGVSLLAMFSKECLPGLSSRVEEHGNLQSARNHDLTDQRRENFFRHQVRSRALWNNARERLGPAHYDQSVSKRYKLCTRSEDALVTAIGRIRNKSMYKNCAPLSACLRISNRFFRSHLEIA